MLSQMNERQSPRRFAVVLGAVLIGGTLSTQAQYAGTSGIFAEFYITLGNFTNRLEFTSAPKACANFIGLATGERVWLDFSSGQVKTNPFFAGITFRRVLAGFMIQSGSRNGQGTDGPGYSFVDELFSSLRHDSFGQLSSANSGPESNGSQFFVTAAPTPWLDDVHTIFGRLFGGSNVAYAINHVSTDTSDKPLVLVVINSVQIRRIGAAALAFDILNQGLPTVSALTAKITKSVNNVSINIQQSLEHGELVLQFHQSDQLGRHRIGA